MTSVVEEEQTFLELHYELERDLMRTEDPTPTPDPHNMNTEQAYLVVVLFYSEANGAYEWVERHKYHRHSNAIIYDGRDFVMTEANTSGFKMRTFGIKNLNDYTDRLTLIDDLEAYFVLKVHASSKINKSLLMLNTCPAVTRNVARINTGWAWTAHQLYKRIIKYDNKRNYAIIKRWDRQHAE